MELKDVFLPNKIPYRFFTNERRKGGDVELENREKVARLIAEHFAIVSNHFVRHYKRKEKVFIQQLTRKKDNKLYISFNFSINGGSLWPIEPEELEDILIDKDTLGIFSDFILNDNSNLNTEKYDAEAFNLFDKNIFFSFCSEVALHYRNSLGFDYKFVKKLRSKLKFNDVYTSGNLDNFALELIKVNKSYDKSYDDFYYYNNLKYKKKLDLDKVVFNREQLYYQKYYKTDEILSRMTSFLYHNDYSCNTIPLSGPILEIDNVNNNHKVDYPHWSRYGIEKVDCNGRYSINCYGSMYYYDFNTGKILEYVNWRGTPVRTAQHWDKDKLEEYKISYYHNIDMNIINKFLEMKLK